MRILLVEDDQKISSFLSLGLSDQGYEVDMAFDGEEGLNLALEKNYDLMIMDLMLPKLDGLSVLGKLRTQKEDLPVLILSAKRSVDDRILGLSSGGDDYMVKPFSFSELNARVKALTRRRTALNVKAVNVLKYHELSLNKNTREVFRGDTKIELQKNEFSLLEFLLENSNQILTKTMILKKIWGYEFDPNTNVVDVLVFRLRNKIDKNYSEKLIHTYRGVGYVLKKGI